ncbi:phenylalanine--tRNA ligase subunit alpha [Candidatus Woesearchaeota archaeon]|jgi:phenylalanyl-tRNA synthetase alpha chain|nr:phenylalanine--tRNA ligase subunit alpha [Candidatus Woesearchaeota archaeon]MBT4368691.1 phenylalanine--tRNA ligase subunit alpha [Candidatus Woesearchaeota archaeon]MBT4711980.1 phenylalanine--tRNA ligase subunit alpha [Candidatus Woesearchaeota archaeon]MBT6638875.1 phenylalanine--tRNA ligase subunit alpha [Candidatus Woesearchaeota archaeon]MBT7134519.1 phenylalanine--tRNA ligase subunit alpha [Candidatus Woesearchaeota archaeon]
MDTTQLIESLHPLEIKVLPSLKKYSKFEYLVKDSNLKDVEVMRALQWLENKKALVISKEEKELVELDVNGTAYIKVGLPEKRLLTELSKGPKTLNEINSLEKQEIGIAIGALKQKAAILMDQGKLSITPQGTSLLEKESLEELFLKKSFPLETSTLKEEEVFALNNLKKRKQIIKVEKRKLITIELTDIGKELVSKEIKVGELIDRLTPELIKSGKWKDKKFRRYDVSINVPQIDGGKRHFVSQALEYAKQVWMDMGFKEMVGQKIQTSFWNFDTLFTPQDHPVREMQDTFFIKTVEKGSLPKDKKLIAAVKDAHENGVQGNHGWGGVWSEEIAKTNILRPHTTCLSSKTLSKLKKEDMPAKFFALGRCFRNESLDWSHLFEFNQTEGIVVDPDATFRNLLGYLKQFFKKMGFEKARFRPAFFPYTEPSVEIDVFHPVHKTWLELGGAGMFRPELTIPLLGEEIPVLAWGPGFDRILMGYYEINDMRELYSNDLEQLRKIKAWNK